MKKLITERKLPLAIVAVVAALLVFLYCKGFRVTYAPDLDNNWDAVSVFAAWAGVVLSFVAIMVAIQIPKRIADQQDKIALFEKRYAVYCEIKKIEEVSELMVKSPNSSLDTFLDFALTIMEYPPLENSIKSYLASMTYMYHTNTILGQSRFLFLDVSEYDIKKLHSAFFTFLMEVQEQELRTPDMAMSCFTNESKNEFLAAIKLFKDKYISSIESSLIF